MKRCLLPPFLFLLSLFSAMGVDFDHDSYGSVADYLNDVFGADDNAGLTAFPVLNIPIGGRAEGMASAFAAVADDASFIEFNPAGSSMLSRSELAFYHNNWIADTKIEGLVYTNRRKNLGFAAAGKWLYTPFTEYNLYGERVSKGYYSEAEAVLNVSYNFFSGYYFSGLSLGANIKGAFRFVPDYADKQSNLVMSGSGWDQSAGMGMADLGALTRFNFLKFYHSRERNSSAALVIRNLGPPSMGEALPSSIVAALSYKPLRPLLFSFDLSLPFNMADLELSERPWWAAALSVGVTSFLSMRGGLMAKSGNVRMVVGSAVILKKIALDVNYTMDLLTQIQPLNRVSLGVRLDLGDQGRSLLAAEVDRLYLEGLDAYAQGDYPLAGRNWTEALKLNPQFVPARESLAILEEVMAVQRRLDDLQRLDF
ncbi:MAG: UPF0164 family protein [Treponema sp.]|jgi:hypothetical protein|nr:UPF0164 family protein [Treponema sp.]